VVQVTDTTIYRGPLGTARVLIVDDEDIMQEMLSELLGADFSVAAVGSAEQALELFAKDPADVVLADKNLPGKTGLELMRLLKQSDPETEIIVMTGYASLESAVDSMRLGAYDYLVKPFDDISIVTEKVSRAAEKKTLQKEHRQLMEQIFASNRELRDAQELLRRGYMETLTSMITALEARDAYTRGHSDRVASIAVTIAEEMGLVGEQLAQLRDGARLHDLGKIGVRENVLNKKGGLTVEEYDHIKTHPHMGSQILGKMEAYRHLLPMVRHHHERWDGRGYPDGLEGENSPLEARIIAVADTFDAMTSKRSYRDPLSEAQALKTIREVSGYQLDPKAVGAFLMAHNRGSISVQLPE
jgi:putative two-component system response regulator